MLAAIKPQNGPSAHLTKPKFPPEKGTIPTNSDKHNITTKCPRDMKAKIMMASYMPVSKTKKKKFTNRKLEFRNTIIQLYN